MNIILLALNVVTLCILCLNLYLSHKERTDLYNRIMSGSANDYLKLSGEKKSEPNHMKSLHRRSIDAFHQKGTEVDFK